MEEGKRVKKVRTSTIGQFMLMNDFQIKYVWLIKKGSKGHLRTTKNEISKKNRILMRF